MTSAEDSEQEKMKAGAGDERDRRGEARKGRGDLSAHPVTTTWNGSMACFLLCPMPGWSLCPLRREMVVCDHWNATETFLSLLTLSLRFWNWTILIITFSHSELLSILFQYCWVILCLLEHPIRYIQKIRTRDEFGLLCLIYFYGTFFEFNFRIIVHLWISISILLISVIACHVELFLIFILDFFFLNFFLPHFFPFMLAFYPPLWFIS